MAAQEMRYQSGFGNEFATEAVSGALPVGQNAPQKHPLGLYTEQFSGTSFTAPRHVNRRTWTYRIRPSVTHKPFEAMPARGLLRSGPFQEAKVSPNQMRWDPIAIPEQATDLIDGLVTMGGNGDPASQTGIAIHLYAANRSMDGRFFYNADGEMLFLPQSGTVRFRTELGALEIGPGEVCLIPRGLKFLAEVDGTVRGYVCENYGLQFRLPELGPIGANGLANARDFLAPVAEYEDADGDFSIIAKFQGSLWRAAIDHSPLDVAGWHGNYVPYKGEPGFHTIEVSVEGTKYICRTRPGYWIAGGKL